MSPTPPIPLPLRNALASLAVRALHDEDARATVRWLAEAAPDRGAPPAGARRVLVEVDLADQPGTHLLAMYEPHHAHVRRHAASCLRAAETAGILPPSNDPVDGALLGAVALWRAGLFFEVHEILEPHWARASGGVKEALQGLIQVAVAFHHLAHGNPRGARTLLRDGRAKLRDAGACLRRVDTEALLADTALWAEALASGSAAPDAAVPVLALR